MDRKKEESKAMRQRFSAEFKQAALARAQKDGVAATARDLGLLDGRTLTGHPPIT